MKLRLICLLFTLLSIGCATTGDGVENAASLDGFWCDLSGTPGAFYQRSQPANLMPAFPRNCFKGHVETHTADACLVNDSICYQLDTGAWCNAGQAQLCPAGTSPMELEAPCPEGGRCWLYSEGLRCYSMETQAG
ncbi:hypothetical protein Mag101_13770 [Microbulbifer agarilyticus]|uniref:Lipoprotein n=1 Tax=Microbulbifer agarilyticus TaxID=260552 RepID=A0A1Q2M7D0_9GAMM|nr:hypothetical protein [Microbulbifer agarilyticus]AQQ68581.1 hypothetical protein Mag101_13770 [Microbulbifer agarilyticus]